jgi:tetratricopeptide (TPR) repeat protein
MIAVLAVLLFLSPLPQESAQRLRAGQEKLKVRDFDGAIPDFERCLQLQPEEFNASFGLGICLWEKEEYKKAREQFARVVELVEKEKPGAPLPGVHQKLLGCAILLEDFDAAEREATHLIQIQATGEYYYDRALARQRKGDLKGALEDAASALKEDSHLTKARSLKAEVLLAQGESKAALEELDEAIRLKPSDPTAFLARACAQYREGHWAEAQRDLQSAAALNKGQNSNLENQGYACAMEYLLRTRLKSPQPPRDAAAGFEKVLKELKRSPSKNHLLALPLYLADQLPETDLLAAAEAAPGRKTQARAEVLFFIAERKLLEGDKAVAREYFKKCAGTGARGNFEHDLALLRLKALED